MSPSSPQQPASGESLARAFHKRAATFSLVAPLAAIGISFLVSPHTQGIQWLGVAFGIICAVLVLSGLWLGIIALVATKRIGRERIFTKAFVGVCIAGTIILVTLLNTPDILRQSETKRAIYRHSIERKP